MTSACAGNVDAIVGIEAGMEEVWCLVWLRCPTIIKYLFLHLVGPVQGARLREIIRTIAEECDRMIFERGLKTVRAAIGRAGSVPSFKF